MSDALYISLWAYLYTIPLSEPDQVFGWLKGLLSRLPEWLYLPLIGCAKCHAGQVAFWWQVWQVYHWQGFNIPFVLIAVAGAVALEKMDNLLDAWTNR